MTKTPTRPNTIALHVLRLSAYLTIQRKQFALFYAQVLDCGKHAFSNALKTYTEKHEITPKIDQFFAGSTIFLGKRVNWLSFSVFSLGLLLGAQTDIYASDDKSIHSEYSVNTLRIVSPSKAQSIAPHPNKKFTAPTGLPLKMSNPQLTQQIDKILTSRLDTRHLPDYVVHDLKLMAEYYSQFPEAVSLLKSIATKPWTLEFKKNTWETQVTGTKFSINSANIIFDTRAAAKLKLRPQCNNNPRCISSPADVLLHELLHTQAIFLDSNRFLKNGGMNLNFYPALHEMDIINSEKQLYRQMEKRDGLKRPQRVKHVGKIEPASCAICIM